MGRPDPTVSGSFRSVQRSGRCGVGELLNGNRDPTPGVGAVMITVSGELVDAGADNAIEHVEAALRLSPRARVANSLSVMGRARFFARRFNEAVPKLLLAIQEDPSNPEPYRYLAACYAHMGRLGNARETVEQLRAITSVVISDDARHLRNPEHRELFLSGLRLAAGEAE
jgi:tetratricopeptide (TPR) repeat protein